MAGWCQEPWHQGGGWGVTWAGQVVEISGSGRPPACHREWFECRRLPIHSEIEVRGDVVLGTPLDSSRRTHRLHEVPIRDGLARLVADRDPAFEVFPCDRPNPRALPDGTQRYVCCHQESPMILPARSCSPWFHINPLRRQCLPRGERCPPQYQVSDQ